MQNKSPYPSKLVCALALLASWLPAAELAPFTPAYDVKGDWTMTVNTNLPNVLILGDSISIGYTRPVRKLLSGEANVFRPMEPGGRQPDNCGDTLIGLENLARWLGTNHWDVIYFNWGLWDLCCRNPAVKTQGNRDKVNGKISVPLDDYARNLQQLVARLQATGARLVWASTTVVPEGEPGRFVGDDEKYNAIAARVMQEHHIAIDDLYALTKSFDGKFSAGKGDVHYTAEGSARIAKQVAAAVMATLPDKLASDLEPHAQNLANEATVENAKVKTSGAIPAVVQETPAQRDARMAWWRDARFGMFIHYGPVTLTGKEISWSRANSNPECPNKGPTPVEVYDNLYRQFNPTNFNASDWTGIAKMAGMKYMVLTTKHGDGFLLWDSKVDHYNIMASPFKRDICAELSQAARQDGLRMGWYFSPMDWRDPDCRSTNNARFVSHIQDELRELLTNYGKIDVLWFDSDGRPTMWNPATTYPLVRGLQPEIIINNRLEMSTFDQWRFQGNLRKNEDFATPEQRVGGYDDQRPWETCMTICEQWSWKPDDKLKSPVEVISILCQTVGGDGNLLLNVGPMPDGRIEPRQVEVLKKVGSWMAVNGESIYGTRGGPWKPTKEIASTRKGSVVYVHVLKTDGDVIELPALPRKIESASVLGGGKIKTETADGKIILHLPEKRDALATVIKLDLDGSAMDIPAITLPMTEARVKQLQDLHWGMFICWSFSTFSGKEWTTQPHGPEFFKATGCDTDQWAKTAKEAGMGYILFLTKHHDGFCLWDTKTTDLKVAKSPLGIDVLARLKTSCEKYGIKLALYFSEGDWNFPGAMRDGNGQHGGSNPEMKKAQLKELLTQYGSIEYIWFDHAQGDGGLNHAETAQWVKSFQPDCFVGFNHGEAAGDIRLGEDGRPAPVNQKTGIGKDSGDTNYSGYRLAEFTYPILPKHEGGANWFYSLPEHDHLCLPAENIYADYLGAVKFGNIFSLDVGPDYAGKLRDIDVQTLHAVGEMIRAQAPTNRPAKKS